MIIWNFGVIAINIVVCFVLLSLTQGESRREVIRMKKSGGKL
jgi:hypothetical protein